jgi:hypothetical protein
MYRFTGHLMPEQVQGIAALVFMEIREAGYAAVGEFHYLDHQPNYRTGFVRRPIKPELG